MSSKKGKKCFLGGGTAHIFLRKEKCARSDQSTSRKKAPVSWQILFWPRTFPLKPKTKKGKWSRRHFKSHVLRAFKGKEKVARAKKYINPFVSSWSPIPTSSLERRPATKRRHLWRTIGCFFLILFFFGDDDPDLTSTLAGPIYFFSLPPLRPIFIACQGHIGGWGIGAKVEIGNGALKQKWTWRNWFLSFFLFSGIARHWVVPLPAELSQRERGKEEEGDLHFGSWMHPTLFLAPSFPHMWYRKAYYSLEGFVLNKNVLEVSSEGKKMSSQTAESGVNFSHTKKNRKRRKFQSDFRKTETGFLLLFWGGIFFKKTLLRRRSNCPLWRF